MIAFDYIDVDAFSARYHTPNPTKSQIKAFKADCESLLKASQTDNEEYQKNELNNFLRNAFNYTCNVKDRIDSCIYDEGKVKVIIEVKQLSNKMEFPKSYNNPLSKAFCQSVFYFLKEHLENENNEITHIIITNTDSFFIFDASEFLKFKKDNEIKQLFENTKNGTDKSTHKFYEDIESYFKNGFDKSIKYTHFNISQNIKNNSELSSIYQILSPQVLLKKESTIDSNTLNKKFYDELLYILGLKEIEQNGKIIIIQSDTKNSLSHSIKNEFPNLSDDEVWELIILWNNRILFLALLESMLLSFKHINEPFLNKIDNFSTLDTLFFEVLAKRENERNSNDFSFIPYLNSSLFDKSTLEINGKRIRELKSNNIAPFNQSILKDKSELPFLKYLFQFLHAYDFTTTPKDIEDGIKKNLDKLINPSVLGLVFEKLNGYKDGSFYTPSMITSYMCKESIRKIVIDKFNEYETSWNVKSLKNITDEIRAKIRQREQSESEIKAKYKKILLSIRICDPAVGSGHFLVSALNEMVKITYDLGLLDSDITNLNIENDEIIIRKGEKVFEYQKPSDENEPNHQVQKELFNLKREIIESCLFGVDINPNSVEITKLRLWIELLKYSYYTNNLNTLQTLPNIDINIKCGNSLIYNFPLDSDFPWIKSSFKQNITQSVKNYKEQVKLYKDALGNKKKIIQEINSIKVQLKNGLIASSQTYKKILKNLRKFVEIYGDECFDMDTDFGMEMIKICRANKLKFLPTLEEIEPLPVDKNGGDLLNNIYKDFETIESIRNTQTLEWRFEFPEVLNENGDFKGFDLIIGNPPYIKESNNKKLFDGTRHLRTYQGKMDIWYHFVGRGFDIVRNQGIVTFIATNNWTTNAGAKNLRNVILNESQILNLVDFGSYMCFDKASIQTMIMEFKKQNPPKEYQLNFAKIEAKKPTDEHRDKLLAKENFKDNIYLTLNITPKDLLNKTLTFVDSSQNQVLEKIYQNGKIFLQDNEIQIGIGLTDKVKSRMYFNNGKVGEGIFQLSNEELINLNLSQIEKELIKPLYTTNELFRFYANPKNSEWVIYTNSSFKHPNSMDNYPNLKKHLDRFKDVITSDNKPYGLHRAKQERFFNKTPSIVSLRKCINKPTFTYVDFDCYVTSTFFILQTNRLNLKFLTGILNSQLIAFWLRHKGKMQGSNYQIDKEPLVNIPLPHIDSTNKNLANEIIALVDKILESKRLDSACDTKDFESKIDKLVYKIYNLNPDEIAIIES